MSNFARLRRAEGITPDDACEHLAHLATSIPNDQNIVEIGVYKAKSLCYLAHGARKSNQFPHVYGIDPWDLPGNTPGIYGRRFDDPSIERDAKMNVRTQGMKRYVTLIKDFSSNVAACWNRGTVGMIYMDGDHRYEHVYADFVSWFHHLANNAIVVFDDYTDKFPSVMQAVDALVEEGVIEPVQVMFDRLAVTRITSSDANGVSIVTSEATTMDETVQGGNTAETRDDDPGVNSGSDDEVPVIPAKQASIEADSIEAEINEITADLMKQTVIDLIDDAEKRGIELPKGARKMEIANIIARYIIADRLGQLG